MSQQLVKLLSAVVCTLVLGVASNEYQMADVANGCSRFGREGCTGKAAASLDDVFEDDEESAMFQTPGQPVQQKKIGNTSANASGPASMPAVGTEVEKEGSEEEALMQLGRPGAFLRPGSRARFRAASSGKARAPAFHPAAPPTAAATKGMADFQELGAMAPSSPGIAQAFPRLRGGAPQDNFHEEEEELQPLQSPEDATIVWKVIFLLCLLSLLGALAVARVFFGDNLMRKDDQKGEKLQQFEEPVKPPNPLKHIEQEPVKPPNLLKIAKPALGAGPVGTLLASMPMPTLSHVGTTYEVPWSRIAHSGECSLSVDVPASPAVWPLRALFVRAAGENAWARIELTVDVIDAAGLPPLLYCTRCKSECYAIENGDTGSSGGSGDLSRAQQLAAGEGRAALVEVCGGSGALAAVLVREPNGRLSVQRPGLQQWEVESHLDCEDYWIVMRKRGQDVALATKLLEHKGDSETQGVQIDTQPDTSSPESVLMLMCMLAMLVFPP